MSPSLARVRVPACTTRLAWSPDQADSGPSPESTWLVAGCLLVPACMPQLAEARCPSGSPCWRHGKPLPPLVLARVRPRATSERLGACQDQGGLEPSFEPMPSGEVRPLDPATSERLGACQDHAEKASGSHRPHC